MLRVDFEVPDELTELYNRLNSSKRGRELLALSGISREKLDIMTVSRDYFSTKALADISVDPNANVGRKSHTNYLTEVAKAHCKLYSYVMMHEYLMKMGVSSKKALTLIADTITGVYYPHDQTKWVMIPYCVAVSTSHLMVSGRPYGQLHSLPPKRADSFMAQVIEYLMDLSQEFAGAVAPADLVVNYSYYVAKAGEDLSDYSTYKQIENDFQKFVHVVNNSFRVGGDSPFVNVSFYDSVVLRNVFKDYRYPDGSSPFDEPYFSTIKGVQKIWMEFIARKDPKTGLPYRFPVVTVNIDRSFEDSEFLDLVCKSNTEGIFNIFVTDGKAQIASCCRLTNSIEDLMKFRGIDSFGNGGVNIGSHRVVTINLPRVALNSLSGFGSVKDLLKERIQGACALLVSHRNLIRDRIEQGVLKFFKPLHWLDLDRMFFSTVGLSGMYEFFEILGIDLRKNLDVVEEYLKFINDEVTECSIKYGVPFNIEQVPAETAAITLCKKDKCFYSKIPYIMYSNQYIPLWKDVSLAERVKVGGELDEYFGGGVITHLNIGSKAYPHQIRQLIKFATECGLKHFALNPLFVMCENGHVSLADSNVCPICGGKIVEKVTRIVGYFVPVSNWVKERREWEINKRVWSDNCD